MGAIASKDFPKDFDRKYVSTMNGWCQLEVGAFGTCIAPSRLPGSAKARSGGSNNLRGITQDGANVYQYFVEHGARIANYEFTVPARPADEVREKVKQFVMSSGNNKFLYLSGHGDPWGDLVLGEGESDWLQVSHVFDWLNEAEFLGHITIMVDACHSGKWANRLKARINSGNMEGMCRASRRNRGFKTFVNLRLSSLSSETSGDTRSGGSYTLGCLDALRKEWHWTPGYVGEGWGTKIFVTRKPDGKTVLWGTGESEPQTDIAVDFVCSDGQWVWSYPKNREPYI